MWQNEASGEHVSGWGRGPYCESADVPDTAYQDGKVAEKAIEDLKQLKAAGEPFFLACGFWRPHLPFNAPKKYWELYDREAIEPAPNRFRPENLPEPCQSTNEIDRYARTGERKEEIEFHREARHAYYACVSYVDAQIGKVVDALDELGLAENTIIVLWGDHGWNLGEHTFWGKRNPMKNSLHAPLIVSAPGHKRGNRTQRLVEFVDIYPTLCELAGISAPAYVDGRSFVSLLDDPEQGGKEAVYIRVDGCVAVKTDRYLYTEWWDADGQMTHRMLFDHRVDPQENVNIAEREAMQATVARLSGLLRKQFGGGG